jgi:hypothetical protein
MKTKVAIARQGGGSQTAFTAGVLKALCEADLQDEFEHLRRRALRDPRLVGAAQGGTADLATVDRVLARQHGAEPPGAADQQHGDRVDAHD